METLKYRRIGGIDARGAAITDVAASPDGRSFAVSFGQSVVFGSWSTGNVTGRFTDSAPIEAIAYAPDSARLAAAAVDGRLSIVDVEQTERLAELNGGAGGYHDIVWSPQGHPIAAGRYEPQVTLFRPDSREPLTTLDPGIFSDEGRTAVAFSAGGERLVSTGFNAFVVWTLRDPVTAGRPVVKRKKTAIARYAFVVDVSFSPDGRLLAALAETEGRTVLHFLDPGSGARRGRIELPNFSQRMAWAADASFVAVIERDDPGLSLWSPRTLERSDTALEGVEASMSAVAAHPSRTALVAGSESGDVFVWESARS